MFGVDGLEAVRRLVKAAPAARILMLTSSEEQPDVLAALDAGAEGYITKTVRFQELLAAIREVHAGGHPLGEDVARRRRNVSQYRPGDGVFRKQFPRQSRRNVDTRRQRLDVCQRQRQLERYRVHSSHREHPDVTAIPSVLGQQPVGVFFPAHPDAGLPGASQRRRRARLGFSRRQPRHEHVRLDRRRLEGRFPILGRFQCRHDAGKRHAGKVA